MNQSERNCCYNLQFQEKKKKKRKEISKLQKQFKILYRSIYL